MPVKDKIWLRRGTAAEWTSANPVLHAGEVGVELAASPGGERKAKIGDGTTAWNTLTYFGGSGGGAVDSVNGHTGVVVLAASDVGADAAGTAASAVAAAVATLIPLTQKGVANGVATLGSDGLVPPSQMPAIAISDFLGTVNSQVSMLALVGQRGDWAIRTDTPAGGSAWILIAEPSTILGNWKQLPTPVGGVSSVNGRTGSVTGLAEASDLAAEVARAEAAEAAISLTPWTTDVDAAGHKLTNLPEIDWREGDGTVSIPKLRAMQSVPWNGDPGLVLAKDATVTPPNLGVEFLIADGGWSTFTAPYGFVDLDIESTAVVNGSFGGLDAHHKAANGDQADSQFGYAPGLGPSGDTRHGGYAQVRSNRDSSDGYTSYLAMVAPLGLPPQIKAIEGNGSIEIPHLQFAQATPYFGEPGWYSQHPTTTAFEHWGGSLSGAAAGEALWLYPEGSRVEHQWFAQTNPATFGFMEAQALGTGAFFSAERWTSSSREKFAKLIADADSSRVEGIDKYLFSNGAKLEQRSAGGIYVHDNTSTNNGHAKIIEFWEDPGGSGDLADTSVDAYRTGSTAADDKTGEMYLEALDGATGHYPFVDIGAQAGPVNNFAFMELSNWDGSLAHFQFVHDVAAGLNYLDSNHLQLLRDPNHVLGFFGTTPAVGQHAAIVNADGTLTDATTKLNTLLQFLRDLGLVHA